MRRDQTLTVTDGMLTIPAAGRRRLPDGQQRQEPRPAHGSVGPWTITTKVNFKGLVQYQQAGIMVYGDDDNYTKFDRVATNAAGATAVEKFEFINEVAGTPRNGSADATGNLAATFPNDFYMRVKSDGTTITGEYSTDGTTWTAGRPRAALPANAKIGVFALPTRRRRTSTPKFDYVTIEGASVPLPLEPR